MSELLHGSTPRLLADHFAGGPAFMGPEKILAGLTAEVACQCPTGSPHSAAQVVAHIDFWQNYILDTLSGVEVPEVEHYNLSWPAVDPGQWELIKTRTLSNLEQLQRIALEESERVLKDNQTVGYTLETYMTHSSYHWGQVVLLRRMLDPNWPAPGDSFTW